MLTALEIKHLVDEAKLLEGAKLDKIFGTGEKLSLQFHITGKGKKMFNVILPGTLYIADERIKEVASEFCLKLRKELTGSFLKQISQASFERVVELSFESQKKSKKLVFELFSKGNVVLLDENDMIISVLRRQRWKIRELSPKKKYILPKKEFDITTMKKQEFVNAVKNSEKDSIVKIIATDIGLGSKYAEEICSNLGIDKQKNDFDDKIYASIFDKIQSLMKKSEPIAYLDNGKILDFSCCTLSARENSEKKEFKTLSEAVYLAISFTSPVMSPYEKQLEKIDLIIEKQQAKIVELQESIETNQEKGNHIYNNYQKILELINSLNGLRKDKGWKEIKDQLKNAKKLKSVDEKNSTITIDI